MTWIINSAPQYGSLVQPVPPLLSTRVFGWHKTNKSVSIETPVKAITGIDMLNSPSFAPEEHHVYRQAKFKEGALRRSAI